ncbi:MAG TPA: hypothetical protein DEQ09_04870 [Bacteroidales bacterium]|nr:hypothetical protein [Bacteroidales bacterium]
MLIGNYSYSRDIERENTKIYTVFLSQGYVGPGGSAKNPLTNNELLDKLQKECDGIDFIVRDMTDPGTTNESVLIDLVASKDNIDGVLIIGTLSDYKLAFSGLPTIVVYNLWEWDKNPYKLFATGKEEDCVMVGGPEYKNGRIITAQLDRRQICDQAKTESMFNDLVDKIKLIRAIKKLKETRILSVSPYRFIAQVDYQGDINKHIPEDYNETYIRELKESLGVEIIRVDPQEFYKAYKESSKKDAGALAEQWMEEAETVEAAKSEIIRTARAYLAFESLRVKYNCNAVSTHMRSLTGSGRVEDRFWPGLGLECGFKTRGIQAVCQDYPDILLAELVAYYITGRPSMLGDLMIDTENMVDILTHCGAPVNPYGDGRKVPYSIKTHAESPVRNTLDPGSSTGMQVEWPAGESVTIWKFYVLHKKIGLHTGRIVDGHKLYKNLDDIMCRTKLISRVNAEEVQKNYFADAYGIHRAATIGDLREILKDFAILIGYEVIEEDRPGR